MKSMSLLLGLEKYLYGETGVYILISILPKIPLTISNYPYLKVFVGNNVENMENALKINNCGKTLSF